MIDKTSLYLHPALKNAVVLGSFAECFFRYYLEKYFAM